MACYDAILDSVSVTDVLLSNNEVHFHFNGSMNRQSFCYWTETSPHQPLKGLYIVHLRLLGALLEIVVFMVLNLLRTKTVTVNSSQYVQYLSMLKHLLPHNVKTQKFTTCGNWNV